jgi:hypothetical protein
MSIKLVDVYFASKIPHPNRLSYLRCRHSMVYRDLVRLRWVNTVQS